MEFKHKGRTVQILPPIKRYMNAIERKLRLPHKIKAKVVMDLFTGVTARHENGESYETIMADMGSPKEVAASINEEMSEYTYRRSPWRFVFLALAVFSGLHLLPWAFSGLLMFRNPSIGIIGGADGPTAIYVTTTVPTGFSVAMLLALLAVGLIGFFLLRRLKPRRDDK